MGRRGWIAVVAALLVAGACGDDDDDDAAPGGGGTGATGATTEPTDPDGAGGGTDTTAAPVDTPGTGEACTEERVGGELTMGTFTFTAGLDPATNSGSGVTGATELGAVYDTLLRWDPATGEYLPHMATGIEPNADFTEWTLTLRDGVTFSNGDPVDAEAVIGSIERLGPQSYQQGFMRGLIEGMSAPDERTVVFRLIDPWAGFPHFLSTEGGMIVNPAVAEALGDGLATDPEGAGAGPFEVVRFAPGEEIVLSAREGYWGGPVCLEQLRFVTVAGAAATYDAFELGELDVAMLREGTTIAQARADGVQSYETVMGFSGVWSVNNREGRPGARLDVRRAITAALDPDVLNDRGSGGEGLMSSAVFHPQSPIYPGVDGPPYDPELARQLVADAKAAGWDGEVELLCYESPRTTEITLASEALLESVGMDVTVNFSEFNDYVRQQYLEHEFDLSCGGLGIEAGPYPKLLGLLQTGSPYSAIGYGSPEMDAALVTLRDAPTQADVLAALGDIQEIWNDTVPSAVYQSLEEQIVWAEHVHGLVFTRDTQVMFHDAYVE